MVASSFFWYAILGMRYFFFVTISVTLFTWVGVTTPAFSSMSGSSYSIPWDAVTAGGGETITGSTYGLRSTQGEITGGVSEGTSYDLRAGYRQLEEPFITSTISGTCALGVLTSSAVSGCRITVTTVTNAAGGFATTVKANGLRTTPSSIDINNVSDGAITAGSEEYGVSTEDSNAVISQFSGGSITSANCTTSLSGPLSSFSALSTSTQSVVTEVAPNFNSVTDVCVAAAISTATVAGNYTDTITFITTGTF